MASGRVLDAKQFLGGADNVINLELLPEQTQSFTYNFNTNVSGYTFGADYSIVNIDTLSYNVADGSPNYASSNVTGYFANIDGSGGSKVTVANAYINVSQASSGLVSFTIPPDRYPTSGVLTPSARSNVVLTIAEFTWTDASSPAQIDSHRFAIVERFSPDRLPGDPTANTNPAAFTSIVSE